MITKQEIQEAVIAKIKFMTGEDFPQENDFYLQFNEIRKKYSEAIDACKSTGGYGYNSVFSSTINASSLWLANEIKNYRGPDSFTEAEEWFEKIKARFLEFSKYGHFWKVISNCEVFLEEEDLGKIKMYFTNIYDGRNILQEQKSVSDTHDYNLTLVVFLISDTRIIRVGISSNHSINPVEHIIQRDLKKVEVNGNRIEFHYHGLHDPEYLFLDTYGESVKLRKEITELREKKIVFK